MANRYWIGGSGNWSDTNHWSTQSGGSGGADIPTSSDDVFIDTNSGFGSGGTITLDGLWDSPQCRNFTSQTGHNYTIVGNGSNVGDYNDLLSFGSVILESGLTLDSSVYFYLAATSGEKTITINNATINCSYFGCIGNGGTWKLQDDLTIADQFYHENGTFDANGHNVTANDFYFYADTGHTPTVVMGSGTWEATGSGDIWYSEQYNGQIVTFTPETSTIKISNSSASNKRFYIETADTGETSKTFNNIWMTGTGTGRFDFLIYGDCNTLIFNDFKIDTPPHTLYVLDDKTISVTAFTVSGTAGNLITLDSYTQTTQFTLSKSSGTVICDYLNITNCKATGGAVWLAGVNSTDSGNNTGWIFKPTNPLPTYFQI